MRRTRDLEILRQAMERRTALLSRKAAAIADRIDTDSRQAAAFITIETYTAWCNFQREYFLSCAYLKPRTAAGAVVLNSNPAIVDEDSAIRDAIPRAKGANAKVPQPGKPVPPQLEPDWGQRYTLVTLASGLSNSAEIISGLSLQSGLFDYLPTVRNFFAHRAKNTASKVGNMAVTKFGIVGINHPTELVNRLHPGRGNSLLSEWLQDLQIVVDDLCT